MLDYRIPRQDGETLVLNGVPCRVTGNAVAQGDVIAYPAMISGPGPWNDVLIRELYPRAPNGVISRSQDGSLQYTPAGAQLLAAKREIFLRGQRVEQRRFERLPPEAGAKSFCCDAYGTSYAVRIFPRSATCETLLAQNQKGLPLEQAVFLVDKLLDDLEDIHDNGLLHLKIDPGVLHLLPGGALILDYVHLWDQRNMDPAACFDCSLPYAAPELRLHNWNEISPAADLYAAAALFYHLIFGHGPQQDWQMHLSQYDAMPASLARIFRKGLHLLPRKRFASVSDFRTALKALAYQKTV